MAISRGLTLFTSDSRPRYATDVLNTLALPVGSLYHFRYETKYVTPEIRNEFENLDPVGTRVLLAFRDAAQDDDNAFMVPVRWATLTAVELILDFYVIRFNLEGYPTFAQTYGVEKVSIRAASTNFVRELPEPTRHLPVQLGLTPFVEPRATADRVSWIDVAKRLALHDCFATTHFLRIARVTDRRGRDLARSSDGHYVLPERQYGTVSLDYFAVQYEEHNAQLRLAGDPALIRVATAGSIALDSRYDSRQVLIQAGAVTGQTSTELEISTYAERRDLRQTVLRLPFRIVRSHSLLGYRVATSAIGAAAVAAPGILRDAIDPALGVVLACLGALILAVGTNVIGSSR